MKNKLFLLFAFALIVSVMKVNAQSNSTSPQVICLQSIETYWVDTLENGGTGTNGSTYTWSVTSPGFLGSITSGQGTNRIIIDWGATPVGFYTLEVIETNVGCPGTPVLLTINVAPPPIPIIAPQAICVGSTATLTVTPAASSYVWSTAATTQSISVSPASATNYQVTVTDANGCSASATGAVTINPGLTANVASQVICLGASATLTVTPTATSYVWSTTETTQSISVSPASTSNYQVTVTDVNGCSGTASGGVTVNTPPAPSIAPQAICLGASATLTVTPTATSYVWSTTETTQSISVSPASTSNYQVTVTDANGCSGTASGSVTVNTPPTPSIAPQTICAGSSATLTANPTGLNYIWSTTETTQSISVSPASASNYLVTVTDANGCSGTATGAVTINPSLNPTVAPQTICLGASATLTATPAGLNYVWSTTETTQSISVSPASATNYLVTVTDANGCSGTASGAVTVNTPPTPSIAPQAICLGASATLTVTPTTASYVWSTTETTQSISVSPASATNYLVTVTDANGCSGTASGAVTVNTPPTPSIAPQAICVGSTATLTVTPTTSSYVWSTTETTQSISVSPASNSNYQVTVTDANGCSGTATGAVTVNTPPTPVIAPQAICVGGTATLTVTPATSSYVWSTTETTQSISVSPTSATNYQVTVTDANGCSGTATGAVSVTSQVVPVFNTPIASPCQNAVAPALPLTDDNGITGTWSPLTINTATPGTVTYTFTPDLGQCATQTTMDVIVNPLPVVDVTDEVICEGQSVVLTATGAVTYSWSPPGGLSATTGSSVTASPTVTTTYTVTGTDANGCTNTTTVTVTVNPLPNTSPIFHD